MIGIDIDSSHIQLLQLQAGKRGPRVIGHACEPMPDDAFQQGRIQDAEAVAGALTRAYRRSGSKSRRAALAIADSLVPSKVVSLPATWSHAQMAQHVMQEVSLYFPDADSDMSLDCQILGPCPDQADQNRVLVTACSKSHIALLSAVMEMSRLSASRVMATSHALHNACSLLFEPSRLAPKADHQLVIDIAPSGTRLNVIRAGQLIQARSVLPGSAALDAWLLRHYQVLHPRELRGAIQTADDGIGQVLDRISSFADQLAPRVARLWPDQSVLSGNRSSAFVTGLATRYPSLVSRLGARLGTTLTPANPLAGCLAGKRARLNGVEILAPGLMIAAGLSFEYAT